MIFGMQFKTSFKTYKPKTCIVLKAWHGSYEGMVQVCYTSDSGVNAVHSPWCLYIVQCAVLAADAVRNYWCGH